MPLNVSDIERDTSLGTTNTPDREAARGAQDFEPRVATEANRIARIIVIFPRVLRFHIEVPTANMVAPKMGGRIELENHHK